MKVESSGPAVKPIESLHQYVTHTYGEPVQYFNLFSTPEAL